MKTTQSVRRREELSEFLRNRRARLRPEDVGLPPGGRRRTPGLRREEVAVLAGVGTSWYVQLEQGRDITVSASVLDAVSRTLRLAPLEREHLYRLAGANPPDGAAEPGPALAEVRRLVDHWMPNPAHVLDRHWNVVALNEAARKVFGLEPGANCLKAFFTDPAYRTLHEYWTDMAPTLVAEFRRDAARHPDDPGFEHLAEELRALSADFTALWSRHDVVNDDSGVKGIDHPTMGRLAFEHSALHFPDRPDLRLILNLPLPGSGTTEALKHHSPTP